MQNSETHITKRKKEEKEIEGLMDLCDDQMEKLRFLKIKKNLIEEFIKLSQCKTDLQKALQLENIKKFLKEKTGVIIQENFRYKEIITSAMIM